MLVDRYEEAFLRKASYILRRDDLAEDAVQDTFLKIYRYADRFTEREGASFSSWAYKILTNTCYTYATKISTERARNKDLEFADLDALGDNQSLSNGDSVSYVHSVLDRLPSNLSRLLKLYFFEDKSYEEIAMVEGMSLSTVKSGLHRAKNKFKDIAPELI